MSGETFGQIMEGPGEAVSHSRVEAVPGLRIHVPASIDVAAIRARTGLSQAKFANRIGVAVATLQGWEQGRRTPDGPARVLLAMLDRNPRIVEDTLQPASAA